MFIQPKRILLALAMIGTALWADQALAQLANTTLQLPTFRVTQFNTAVSVPDGGTISLGGNVRGSSFSNRSRGGFNIGGSSGGGSAQVTAHVLIMSELEQEMLNNSRPAIRQSKFTQQQINGNLQTQSKADFITDNINRR